MSISIDIGVCFAFDPIQKASPFSFLNSSCETATSFKTKASSTTFVLTMGKNLCPQTQCGDGFAFRAVSLLAPDIGPGWTVDASMLQNGEFVLPVVGGLTIAFTQFNDTDVWFTIENTNQTKVTIGLVVTVAATDGTGLPLFSSGDPQIILEPPG